MLDIVPVSLKEANAFVEQHHRHHKPVAGHKFSIGCTDGEQIVGVAIIGRPVARYLDDGWTLEVNRLATDGTRNACSMLHAAAWRAARAMGYKKLSTYILACETGSSLREVQIENCDAAELIRRFNNPNVLVYCDPPYVMSTRYGKQYKCEMTNDDHVELLDTLKRHKGPVVISGYQSELYDQELAGWRKDTTTSADQLSKVKSEVLWMNFDPPEQMRLDL